MPPTRSPRSPRRAALRPGRAGEGAARSPSALLERRPDEQLAQVADKVGLVVAINTEDDTLRGIGVTTHKETPGLGGNAKADPSFAAQFKGKSIEKEIKVTNDGGEISALSGATITSRAVTSGVREILEGLEDVIKKE